MSANRRDRRASSRCSSRSLRLSRFCVRRARRGAELRLAGRPRRARARRQDALRRRSDRQPHRDRARERPRRPRGRRGQTSPAPGAFPSSRTTPSGGEGLSRDGKRLVVGMSFAGTPTRFTILDTQHTCRSSTGSRSKATSPTTRFRRTRTTLYLIQHVDVNNVDRYVVRAYDLRSHALRPGRIADKTQPGWVMEGSAVTRATSGDGRWVYTLFTRPGGYPFVHALDTVNGSAHCIGLPWHGDQAPLTSAKLMLGDGERSLAVRLKSGRTWLTMNTASWRLTHATDGGGFAWRWPLAAAAGAALLARHPRRAEPPAPAERGGARRVVASARGVRARPRRRRGADGRRDRAGRRRIGPPRVAARSVPRRDRARARGDAQEPRAARREGRRAGRRGARARHAGRRARRGGPDDRSGRRGRGDEGGRLPSRGRGAACTTRSSRRTRRRSRSRRSPR